MVQNEAMIPQINFGLLVPLSEEEQNRLIAYQKSQIMFLEKLMKEVMEEGIDYGKETGIKEPFIRKPGSQRLKLTFGFQHEFIELDSKIDLGQDFPFIYYKYKCKIYNARGEYLGDGDGACSNYEKKYRYSYGEQVNDPLEKLNTVLKMAQKRAFVEAILNVTGASRLFISEEEIERVKNLGDQGDNDSNDPGEVICPFGFNKGKPLKELGKKDLQYVIEKSYSEKVKQAAIKVLEKLVKTEIDAEKGESNPNDGSISTEDIKVIVDMINSKDEPVRQKSREIAGKFMKNLGLDELSKVKELSKANGQKLRKALEEGNKDGKA